MEKFLEEVQCDVTWGTLYSLQHSSQVIWEYSVERRMDKKVRDHVFVLLSCSSITQHMKYHKVIKEHSFSNQVLTKHGRSIFPLESPDKEGNNTRSQREESWRVDSCTGTITRVGHLSGDMCGRMCCAYKYRARHNTMLVTSGFTKALVRQVPA